jgi:hypothetical protein
VVIRKNSIFWDVVYYKPPFWRNVSPPSSGQKKSCEREKVLDGKWLTTVRSAMEALNENLGWERWTVGESN